MAAVCEQLGANRVTVRAVHRLTGGSHRDVSAVVKLWRDRHAEVGALLSGVDARTAIQAVGAIVLGLAPALITAFIGMGGGGAAP